MRRFATALLVSTAAVFALPTAYADTASAGYQLSSMPNPAFGAATATLAGGEIVTFDGISVDLWNANGAFIRNLGTFPGFVFPSFVEVTPSGTAVVLGESSNHELHVAQVDGSGMSFLAAIVFNFDAVFDVDGSLIVSASTTGGSNDLVRVDLTSGGTSFIGNVAGPSGPLAMNAAGDLYYATQTFTFPAPPGSTDVVFWSAAQVGSGNLLTNGNATTFGAAFDGGASMAFDPVADRLYLAENNFGESTYRLRQVNGPPAASPVVVVGDEWISTLDFVNGGGPASFDAFQPSDGSNLKYNSTDFTTFSDQYTISPQRPDFTVSGPGTQGVGEITFTLENGVPNGGALLLFAKQGSIFPTEQVYLFAGFLLHSRFDLSRVRRTLFYYPSDANGKTEFTVWNPGGLENTYHFQFLVSQPTGQFLGSSNGLNF